MKMTHLELDLSHATGDLSKLESYQNQVSQIHFDVLNKKVAEKDWLGWYDLPNTYNKQEYQAMKDLVAKWEKLGVQTVVVIGIGGSYLGAKAGYEFLFGEYPLNKPKMELVFAGNDMSAEALYAKLAYVKNKKFAINVISKSGTTLEPSMAFREFRNLLEAKESNPSDYVAATTDQAKGVLFELAKAKNYPRFVVPDDVGGRFSVFTAVGLLPFLCAGIDVDAMLQGARIANEELASDEITKNPAYAYAAARTELNKKGFLAEMFVSYEPKMQYFAEWWKQLFAESEGKDGKGIWPMSSIFSTDLHSLGQMIQDGNKILFETILTLKHPAHNITFKADVQDLDKLKFLDGNNLHEVNNVAFKATMKAHVEVGGVPNIHILFDKFNAETLGALFMFFERALTMSAYLQGVNPFNQPGVEVYKKNMFALLGKK